MLLTLSRGGILCFVAGQLLFIGLRLWQRAYAAAKAGSGARAGAGRQRPRLGGREIAALPIVLAIGLASGAYVAMRAIVDEFVSGDASKFDIWIDALPMLGDYALTGSGRGTFQMAYTAYQALPDDATYVYPENFLANWVGEWGAPAGGGLVLALIVVLVVGLLRPPSRARNAGSLAAVFALLVQNFADFGLELLGVLLPFLVCLGVETMRIEMATDASMERLFRPLPGAVQRWLMLPGPVAAILVAVLGMPGAIAHEPVAEDRALRRWDYTRAHDDAFGKALDAAMARHPSDYHLPLLGGIRAYHAGRSNPLPLLARSIRLFPRSSVAHLYVARTLARGGRIDQALVEYMESARSRPALLPRIADEVIGIAGGFEDARDLARLPEDRVPVYVALAAAYLRASMPDEARRADVAALGIDASAPEPLVRAIRRHMDAGMWDEAMALVNRLGHVPGYEGAALAFQGEVLTRTGRTDEAIAIFEAAVKKDPGQRGLLVSIASIHLEHGRQVEMFAALDRYQASAGTEEERGDALKLRGSMAMRLGLDAQALSAYQEASSSLPDDAGVWRTIAGLYEKSGDSVAALSAYRELARIEPENPEWKQKIDALYLQARTGIKEE